jgi:hypothetical protein
VKFKPLPRLGAPLLPLYASAFLVLAYNFTFWKTFALATGGAHLANVPVYVGAFITAGAALQCHSHTAEFPLT